MRTAREATPSCSPSQQPTQFPPSIATHSTSDTATVKTRASISPSYLDLSIGTGNVPAETPSDVPVVADAKICAFPNAQICEDDLRSTLFSTLACTAVLASHLAKALKERPREQRHAYKIKTQLCEVLMAWRRAYPTNVKANGDVGFELYADRQFHKLHIPIREFSGAARKIVRARISRLPVVARLVDIINGRGDQ